jgi:hypothetical protein
MSIYKVQPQDVSTFTVVTNPYRYFSSSSITGTTGSVNVFARRSSIEKELTPLSSFVEATHDDSDIATLLKNTQMIGKYAYSTSSVDLNQLVDYYMDQVNAQGTSARKQKALDIIRFTPSVDFTSNTLRKLFIKDQLSTYHRTAYPSAHWAYTNYNSINFFTSSTVPADSCLMYPNIDNGNLQMHEGYVSGTYTPSSSISFDFYIKPSYQPDQINGNFHAGTILHLSSTYALSLVTGSSIDYNGRPTAYRLLMQFSHSADIAPSMLKPAGYDNRACFGDGSLTKSGYADADLAFLSDDNALPYNNWSHVIVRWGTNITDNGTGSILVNGVEKGFFSLASSTIAPRLFVAGGKSSPDVLFVGNYYEGTNQGPNSTSYFFALDSANRDGLEVLNTDGNVNEPTTYTFRHQLNAELHDLAIKRKYMTDEDIAISSSIAPKSIDNDIAFYLPPFFIEDSPFRKLVGDHGGILQTPFFEVDGTTNDPFNAAMSFGVAGHYINIENYLRDFASDVFPRVHMMTGTAIPYTTEARTANQFLYDDPLVRRRNLLLLPCDDGNFVPGFELIASESNRTFARDDLGVEELSFVHLDQMIMTSSLLFGFDNGSMLTYVNDLIGFTPEQPGISPGAAYQNHINRINKAVAAGSFDPGLQEGAPLTIFQRTRDPSSNQVVFFDISNLYYGLRILPKTVNLYDPCLSGSGGAISVTLKDDGNGTIYRADCVSTQATWNAVGTVFYDEGIIAIKSPHLYFYGKEGFEISFKGQQNIHVMSIDAFANANQLNSSSNPNYIKTLPTNNNNDVNSEFVYITGINFHDENYNVVMKTQLSQPVTKRTGDKYQFRVKLDM